MQRHGSTQREKEKKMTRTILIKRFKEGNRYGGKCPFCGKMDWCGYIDFADTNSHYVYCHRFQQLGMEDVSGNEVSTPEGRFVYMGVTDDGFARFRDYASWKAHQDELAEKKGKGYARKSPQKPVTRINIPATEPKKTVEQAAIRDVDYLDRVYRKMLGLLVLEECDIKELREHDGWSQERMDTILRKYPIRSLPPADWERFDKEGSRYAEFKKLKNPTRKRLVMKLQEEFGPEGLSGVPGFYQKKDEAWTIAGMDGYLIPQYNQDGKLYRLRIRTSQAARDAAAKRSFEKMSPSERQEIADSIDASVEDENVLIQKISKRYGKYVAMSSSGYKEGCASGSQLSFYGLEYLKSYPAREKKRVIICEGEKKGIVASEHEQSLVITLPGVGTYRLIEEIFPWLVKVGIDRIAVANDLDMMQNAMVRDATIKLLCLVEEKRFIPEMGLWSAPFGKGIDDCIIRGGKPEYKKITGLPKHN